MSFPASSFSAFSENINTHVTCTLKFVTGSTSCSRFPVVTSSKTAKPNSGVVGIENCMTKLGKGIEFVLGKSNEVLEFDKARQQHKRFPSDKFFLDKFMKRVAVMEVKILKQEHLLRAELGQWEKDFYLKNNKVATQEDITTCLQAKALRDKLKYAKAILMKIRNRK